MLLNDLWIGDYLKLKKSGRIGRFEGKAANEKLKIRLNSGKIVLTSLSNVEKMPDDYMDGEQENFYEQIKIENQSNHSTSTISDSIDLHIEKLFPKSPSTRPERILQLQIEAAKNYLDQVVKNKLYRVVIIHGKGEGVLKSEIHHLLSLYKQVKFTLDLNKGGATEILFQYS